jgi:hypothetical protein
MGSIVQNEANLQARTACWHPQGQSGMGIFPMSRRAIPRLRGGRFGLAFTGETPVILMGGTPMLREPLPALLRTRQFGLTWRD